MLSFGYHLYVQLVGVDYFLFEWRQELGVVVFAGLYIDVVDVLGKLVRRCI